MTKDAAEKKYLAKSPYTVKGDRSRFNPSASGPYTVSRSGIDLFTDCPRCFYLDKRLGVGRPEGPGFALNSAVDVLLKNEFDAYRARGEAHPLMKEYGIDAVPFSHPDLDAWRDSLRRGVQYRDERNNLIIRGGIDDVWVTPKNVLHIVDYKSTSKRGEPSIDDAWYHENYKRQVEVYQWLFRKNGFEVSDVAYFVYPNGDNAKAEFGDRLEFKTIVISYKGDTSWIEPVIERIGKTLRSDELPESNYLCHFCGYTRERLNAEGAVK